MREEQTWSGAVHPGTERVKFGPMFRSSTRLICALLLTMFVVSGCTFHPPGERDEIAAAARAGKPFEKPIATRAQSSLPDNPTQQQLVDYALLANSDLEQRFWEWRSAIEQIPQDGTQTTTLNIAAGTNITNGHTGWGSSSLAIGNDPMTDIKWPGKLDAAARQSLENARAAGHRFVKARYDLRSKVLSAYYDYALNAELIRLDQRNRQLLQTTATLTDARNGAGNSNQEDVLKTRNDLDLAANDIATMQSQLPAERAAINALLGRPWDAALAVPNDLPAVRSIDYSDSQLVDLAAKQNPELVALSDEIRGRDEGVRLARLQYMPDFNLSAGTDLMGVTQSLLGQATIPFFRYEALNAAIAQAQSNLHASEAMRHQTGNDLAAAVVSEITFVRDSDRQLSLFEQAILPRAEQAVDLERSAYENGHASLLDVLDAQRMLIGIERLIANLKVSRAKHLAALESFTAADLSKRM